MEAETPRPENERPSLRPFYWVALIYGVLVLLGSWFLGPEDPAGSALWGMALWLLCVLDLVSLAKVIGLFLGIRQPMTPQRKAAHVFQTLFWSGAKVACLGSFAAVLTLADGAPSAGILLGTSTLVVVPLAGGFWWSQKELKDAS